jgi:hypothetical protein
MYVYTPKTFNFYLQAYLGDIAGSVPDHRNKATYTIFWLHYIVVY